MRNYLCYAIVLTLLSTLGFGQQTSNTNAEPNKSHGSVGHGQYNRIPENYVPTVKQSLESPRPTEGLQEEEAASKYVRDAKPKFDYPPYDYAHGAASGPASPEVFDPASFLTPGSDYKSAEYGSVDSYGPVPHADNSLYNVPQSFGNSHQSYGDSHGYGGGAELHSGGFPGSSSGGKPTYGTHEYSSSGEGYQDYHGHDQKAVYGGEYYGGFKPILKTLGAFLPLGLLLAALPPNVINLTVRKRRSTDSDYPETPSVIYTNPVLEMIEKNGLNSLESPNCQRRVLCELAILGNQRDGNSVQRFLWNVANMVPDLLSSTMGLRDTFRAVRSQSCQQFHCPQAQGMK